MLTARTMITGAIRLASVTAHATSHGDTVSGRGQRRPIASAAAATATTASATADPAGASGTGSALTAAATRAKASRTCPARPANRRSQPRTVSAGTPSNRAIRRCPTPRAAAASADPITPASSGRRASTPPAAAHASPRTPGTATGAAAPPCRAAPARRSPACGMPPRRQPPLAARARQTAFFQHPLDAPGVLAYREHRCSFAPARGSPRGLAKRSRGGPPRNRHAHGVVEHHSPQPQPAHHQPAQPQ